MAFDCFMEISGVKGECTDSQHKEWIEVLSYHHALGHPGGFKLGSKGSAVGQADHEDFKIRKTIDSSTPVLALKCHSGEMLGVVALDLCRATGEKSPYMHVSMVHAFISKIEFDGEPKEYGALPTETVTFRYSGIHWRYITYDHRTGKKKGQVHHFVSLAAGVAS